MKDNLTELCLIVDTSGSMAPLIKDTVGGVNSFIEEQRKVEGGWGMPCLHPYLQSTESFHPVPKGYSGD